MSAEAIGALRAYVVERHLDGRADIEPDTPLLEWGILDSFSVAELLEFIHTRFGVAVPPSSISPVHFRTLQTIADLVVSLQEACRVQA